MTGLTRTLKSLLPGSLQKRLKQQGFKKIMGNTAWLFAERIAKMVLGLFIIVWVARYLGPERFGVYNFSLAFVALFSQLTTLGLEGIVVRDLVSKPDKRGETLGTSFMMRLFGGLFSLILAGSLIFFLRPGDKTVLLFVTLLSLANIFRAFETIDYHFQSLVQSKYTVIVKLVVLLLSSLSSVVMILTEASLVLFIGLKALEIVLINIGLLLSYSLQHERFTDWTFSLDRAKNLLGQSWPLILSGFGAIIYFKLDQVMLGQMQGDSAVGIYSVAAQLSELWYFVPFALVSSLFPALIKTKKESGALYQKRLQNLYDLLAMTALAISVPVALLSGPVIAFLYGDAYRGAGTILSIHIWASIFIFMRAALSKWLIIENLFIFSLVTHGLGALVNVVLNLLLIPPYSGAGAAVATLLSYATAAYFALFVHPRTWPAASMMSRALLFPVRKIFKVR